MTISSSLNAGVGGLIANASKLATISDNIANSATHGYKRAEADFHSMVISSGNGTYSAGGVRVTTSRQIDQTGSMLSTSNATDLAVRGRGFLPVTNASALNAGTGNSYDMSLTTTGSFTTDDEGYLTTGTGLVLLGWPANADGSIPLYPRDTQEGLEPVQINANQFAGEPTTQMTLGVNLPATRTDAGATGDPLRTSIEYFDNLGTSRQMIVEYEPQPAPSGSRTNEWIIRFMDEGTPNTSFNPTMLAKFEVVFNDTSGNGGTIQSVTQVNTEADPVKAEDFDPLLSILSGYDSTTGRFTIDASEGKVPIEINLGAYGNANGNGLSQLSDSFAPTSILKDGSPVGNMVSVDVDQNGYVYANFDIGITRTIYQIPLVDLPNPNGLNALDNQTYSLTNESGSFFLWDAGDGPTGDIINFALEESATDVAGELTALIQTQRAYSSNAKVIQTVDEMLQETTNIKR